jgi:DNA-binding IclR family transcriptional regulator
MMTEEGTQKPPVKSGAVRSAMAILRLLANTDQRLGVNAIARELSLAPSSCFKILKALLADDFVEIDTKTKSYSLGAGAISVARRALDPSQAFAIVRSRLEETAQAHGMAIGLWRMLPNSRMVLIGFAEGGNQMRIHMSIGQRLPIFVGAIGRAIAAHLNLSAEKLKQSFDKLRWQTPLSFSDYTTQVEQAKRAGFGLDQGYFAKGVNTVAVTIVDAAGVVRYGLSGIMFDGQHDQETMEKIAREMIDLGLWAAIRLVNRPCKVIRSIGRGWGSR